MEVTLLEWENILKMHLQNDEIPYDQLYQTLLNMKQSGLSRELAYQVLINVREYYSTQLNEEKEDAVLEMMDVVCDACQPEQRIW